ncbi:MAG: hypothetical protein U9O50_01005 [Acidobacteriota bacterium]|nr:hypothetical protein [Acidobacteriota bacterium]
MKKKRIILTASGFIFLLSSLFLFSQKAKSSYEEMNNLIRREKFDLILPEVMREHHVDMWIHVMRESIPDSFGAEELGSTSGVFIFTDRGGDRIERAVLGRRWGASQREREKWKTKLVEECGLFDIIGDSVRVQEPVGSPMTEYDYRFKGLREFIVARDPKCIAVNFKHDLGPWVTYTEAKDGISHTDYLLLTEELGHKYAKRLVSSEYVMMDYIIRTVPSEIQLLKKMRKDEVERVKKVFSEIKPGITKTSELGETGDGEVDVVVYRRRSTGLSQRGRSKGWENSVVQGGDIVAAPSQGMYAYVLREGETEPPPEIKKLWAEYLKIDKILAETIKAGLTPREIIRNYKRKFDEAGIIVRDEQLHMVIPKNNFPVYSAGFDPEKTHLSLDCHGMKKGACARKSENYFGPRIGSLGPDWSKNIPLPLNHHFVLEYFFYMPSPSSEYEDQYLFFWDHEQAIATEKGVEYLSPPQKEFYLIK